MIHNVCYRIVVNKVLENLYIDVKNYPYAYGDMADCPDDGSLRCSSILANNVDNISTSSETVTFYSISLPVLP